VTPGVSTHASAREATGRRRYSRRSCRVSTHASAREATYDPVWICRWRPVSTHASAREATRMRRMIVMEPLEFQPTPPRGRRPAQVDPTAPHHCTFQPTPPRGRRRMTCAIGGSPQKFQPTPPRGRRRDGALGQTNKYDVSTHASAREATPAALRQCRRDPVSTHASAREATYQPSPQRSPAPRFNPRLRAGGDARGVGEDEEFVEFQPTPPRGRRRARASTLPGAPRVSTHASAREATGRRSCPP